MLNKNCFAYRQNETEEKCVALDKIYCKEEKCSFYKTVEEEKINKTKYPEKVLY